MASVKADDNFSQGSTTFASPPSYQQDVLPILTRFGCNQGACHGKLAGQNGFRLSLRGYASDWDYDSITHEFFGRRIDRAAPANSLLVTKPAGMSPHGGGKLFEPNSAASKVLTDWIAAGTPGIIPDEPVVQSITVSPGTQTMHPGETLQLTATAEYSNGQVRDITWLSQFFSNDPSVLEVSSDGLLKCLRSGESVVRVHFQGHVAVTTISSPFEQSVDAQLFAERRSFIDEHVFNKLAALRIPPSPAADDDVFVRRVFLDTIGTLPTPTEVQAFLNDQNPGKRKALIDKLLERPEFADYWTLILCDLLQNRKERDHDVRGSKGVRAMQAWVREQVETNRPWDEIARDVITASGDSVSQPQIGYYVVSIGEYRQVEDSEVVSSVAQSFLGTRIGCAKCHNHPLERYTQDDYYHFAAYFGRMNFQRQESHKGATALIVATEEEARVQKQITEKESRLKAMTEDQANRQGAELESLQKQIAEVNQQLENERRQFAELTTRIPRVRQPRTNQQLAAQPLDRSETKIAPGQDPRELLAQWMTDPGNENFSGSMVNRLWRHFFAVGLVEPVDDLRISNPPSNRELWTALNQEFVSHKYDLRHIMRLILNSRTYQLSSATLKGNAAESGFYSHYYVRRLPAEVFLDAISQSTLIPDSFPGYPVGMRAIQLPDSTVASPFLSMFGRSERVTACACERSGDVTLPQLLHLQCGDGLAQKFDDPVGRLKQIMNSFPDDKSAIEQIYLATLSRSPTTEEQASITAAFEGNEQREEAFRDLFWALLNTKEFAFNH
ncbi:MAG: DUF1549 domain-containing protein [Planctomycetales bacterium]|nr:DUF1549 domain-containing protein [Planctomycetales bacterium]